MIVGIYRTNLPYPLLARPRELGRGMTKQTQFSHIQSGFAHRFHSDLRIQNAILRSLPHPRVRLHTQPRVHRILDFSARRNRVRIRHSSLQFFPALLKLHLQFRPLSVCNDRIAVYATGNTRES